MKKIYASFMRVMLAVLTNFVMAQGDKTQVLVLIHPDHGGIYELAKEIVKGVERSGKVQAVVELVKKSSNPKLSSLAIAIARGNTVLGTTSLVSSANTERPSKSKRYLAELQGIT